MSDNGEIKKSKNVDASKPKKWKTRKVKKAEADIVQTMLDNPSIKTAREVAKKLGRPESTICRIMRSPEVKVRLKEILYDFVDKELIHAAIKNITNSIINNKNVADSKWLAEHMDFFPEKSKTGDDDPWKEFQAALANGITEVIKQCNLTMDKDGDGEGAEPDPETFVYYQPQRPVVEN